MNLQCRGWFIVRNLALPLCLLLTGGVVAWAQGFSSISGRVTDQTGAVISDATITLIKVDTQSTRTLATTESGKFVFDLIPPGIYRVEAEAGGFKKAVVGNVRALVDKTSSVDLQLEVGDITEIVNISATAGETLINYEDASLGNNFEAQEILQFPLESRNVVTLLSVQPGVTKDGYVTGSRSDEANVTLDGVDVNEQQTGLDIIEDIANDKDVAFSSVLRVTPDSVQEFRVTTSNPNANQGRSAGAQVSLVTKSGSNDWHGSLYEYHRNTVTTANDFFNNRAGIERPALIRNVFGGSVGGPLVKNRAFFFYTYEGRRDAKAESIVRPVPLASLGRGEVRYPNTEGGLTVLTIDDLNRIYPVGVNPVGLAVLADAAARFPANDDTEGDGFNTGGFRFNAPLPLAFNTHILRMDFNLTEDGKHILFFKYQYQYDKIGGVPRFPDAPSPDFWNHPTGYVVGHTWSISNTLVNSFRYGQTREAFTNQGDSAENFVSFRFVFQPRRFTRTLSRKTPTHNIVDDISWIKGNHNLQFGTNIRIIRNDRVSFGTSFDSAIANPSFYDFSGAVLSDPLDDIGAGFTSTVQSAVSAVIGRFSQYTARFNFLPDGSILPEGEGVAREFATEEYDFYIQDSWKIRPNLTLTYGLRYGLSRPVYETNGVQVKPTTSLGGFLDRRIASAANGNPLNELITFDLAGPVNDRPGFYDWDTNDFQPRVALAWSPHFESGFLSKLFGREGQSVFRGGFAITNGHLGQQLAVRFDLNNADGFASSTTIAANTYNVTDRPAPLFQQFGQNVRSLPGIDVPDGLTFPLSRPADEAQRILQSLDDTITSPIHYSWNVSFGRELPAGLLLEVSYVGRIARNLLASRDVMALNNLVDPGSGLDWYTAAGMLHDQRFGGVPIDAVQPIAYFENLFPNLPGVFGLDPALSPTQTVYSLVSRDGFDILDWTFIQLLLDDRGVAPNLFFHPQYAALSAFSTFAKSDYHAGTVTLRQRFRDQLFVDFNYTLSKSIDNASGLQNSSSYGSAFVLNPLQPDANRSVSDFDTRHIINAAWLWRIPIGRGRANLTNLNGIADALLGGWQLSGIFRWNSGTPVQCPFDQAQWATNWNVQSCGVRVRPIESSPTRGGAAPPNLFEDPVFAYQSFRNARPGETGDRNALRRPGFVSLDFSLAKSFRMPWSENHTLQFRWEVFNATNTQRLGDLLETRSGLGLVQDPQLSQPSTVFGNFTGIQGTPRVMQFALRYDF